MGSPPFPYPEGETVTLVKRTRAGVDTDGNDAWTVTLAPLAGVPVWPGGEGSGTTGSELEQARNTVLTGISFLLPYATDLTAVDAVDVYGVRYEIQGEPARFRHPRTGMRFLMVRASRAEG
jgi:hypothetical protein